MAKVGQSEKSFLGEPIVHVEAADPRNCYPADLREKMLALDRGDSVSTEAAVEAGLQTLHINHSTAVFKTAIDVLIEATLKAHGYDSVTEHEAGSETGTVYALPPIKDREEALAIGGIIRAGYEFVKSRHPDDVGTMPTLAFPQAEQ